MYPEDRVLVAYMPKPADFGIARQACWYRIPQRYAPKGLHAEYVAFYFGRQFGPDKWSIQYFARRLGHELVTRASLLPDQADHPRAQDWYYKVQLGPLQRLERPIISLRWRRLTFLHTTWDRFQEAAEINDLVLDGGAYVDRIYAALKERGIRSEREYRIEESGHKYVAPLVVLCHHGPVEIPSPTISETDLDIDGIIERIEAEVSMRGGPAGCV